MKRLRRVAAPARPVPTPAEVCADFEPYRLISARRAAGMSRKDLAPQVGVEPWQVAHWETGISTPKAYQLEKVAEATGHLVAFFKRGRPMAIIDSSQVFICSIDR